MSQQVTLPEVLKKAVSSGLSEVYTSIPGIIVTVRDGGSSQYVDVQPTLNILDENGSVVERPVILNVPLQQFSSDLGGLLVPVRVGTPCWLHFSMRGLDVWKRSNARPSTPTDDRRFNRNDCYATVGVMPIQMSLQDQVKHNYSHDPNDVVVVHGLGTEQETEIRLHVSGGVTVNTKQSVTVNSENVEVNATATTLNSNLQVNGTINSTGIIKSDVDVQGNTVSLVGHIHPFVGTGPGVASTTSAPTP